MTKHTTRACRRVTRLCSAWLLVVAVATSAHADQTIAAGGIVSLSEGSLDLGCTDLFIAGTLNLDAGTLRNVRDLSVLAGGVLNGGSGSLSVAGAFSVDPAGEYNPDQVTVRPGSPVCGAAAPAPAPALGDAGMIALVAVLIGLAGLRFRYENARWRAGTSMGASS